MAIDILRFALLAAGIGLVGFSLYGIMNSRAPNGERVLARPIHLAAFYGGVGLGLMPTLAIWPLLNNTGALLPPLMLGAGAGILLGAYRQRRRVNMISDRMAEKE